MEENNGIKLAQLTNLPTVAIKSQLNLNIDSNTHIKQVLNIDTCLIDCQIEPMSNKALIKGCIGIKVIYVDFDNIYSTIADTINFSETLNSELIDSNCDITVINSQFINEFDNDEQSLHINIDGNLECLCNFSSNLNIFNRTESNLITKKSSLPAFTCIQKINKSTNFDFEFKLGSKINKMLSTNSKIIVEETKCYDGYILLTGQITNSIIYEIEHNGTNSVKICNNSTPFKCEVEASSCDNDCLADISSYINLNSTQITTDITENDTIFKFEYCIISNGHIYKIINVDMIEDIYSLDNEIELINNDYNICKKSPNFKTLENIDAEITLADELNIDEIVGMVNTNSSITQYSVKDNNLVVEGVVNGNLLYLDENHNIKQLPTQLPYSINLKQEFVDKVCALRISIVPNNCKCKIKRGNTLIVDYELNINGCAYTKNKVNLLDNIKLGKAINYGEIAFQIYLAQTNESSWDLCKRLHITKEKLIESNKENPATYLGGEKIIVYR